MKYSIGFTGSRKGLTDLQKEALIETLKKVAPVGGDFHHGLAIGADFQFHQICQQIYQPEDCKIIGHPPIPIRDFQDAYCDEIRQEREPLVRNREIVDECDVLIACPDGPERLRSGTWSTVRYCREVLKRRRIIYPNGTVKLC